MNFFGLNRAAINGNVVRIIAGAALVVASFTSSALALRTAPSDGPISTFSSFTADATIIRPGGAGFTPSLQISAFGSLLYIQTVYVTGTATLQATNTEAYQAVASTLAATGTITQSGVSASSAVSSGTATGLATVGFASNFVALSSLAPDPGVRRSGATTTERDGYASGAALANFQGTALKTALPTSTVAAFASMSATGIKTHGGSADFPALCVVLASASTDAANIFSVSSVSAAASVTRYFVANSIALGSLSATPMQVVSFNGLLASTLMATAAGDYAQQGAAQVSGVLGVVSQGVVVVQSAANLPVYLTATASGDYAKPGVALATATLSVSANGTAVLNAAAIATSGLTASAAANYAQQASALAVTSSSMSASAVSQMAASSNISGGLTAFAAGDYAQQGAAQATMFAAGSASGDYAKQGAAQAAMLSGGSADGRPHMLAQALPTGVATVSASGDYAKQGAAQAISVSYGVADGRPLVQAQAAPAITATLSASGTITRPGVAFCDAQFTAVATGIYLKLAYANTVAVSSFSADPSINATAPDPDYRTMHRPFTERALRRAFVERNMRRAA